LKETRLRVCPFCEATCGLAVEVEGRSVVSVSGDAADVFSAGHLCPKGVAIRELDADPDRLRRPLLRRGSDFEEASWDEAFAFVDERLPAIQAEHGRDAVGVFIDFTISQAGMVRHWLAERPKGYLYRLAINATGCAVTATVAVIVTGAKAPTSLIVILLIPCLVAMMLLRPEGLFPSQRRKRELHTEEDAAFGEHGDPMGAAPE